jgi:hypothetical protein
MPKPAASCRHCLEHQTLLLGDAGLRRIVQIFPTARKGRLPTVTRRPALRDETAMELIVAAFLKSATPFFVALPHRREER